MTPYFSKRFKKQLRALEKGEAARVADFIDDVIALYGNPHCHSGLGIRKLQGSDGMEFRVTRALRCVFLAKDGALYFELLGNHDEVEAWVKNNR